MCGTYTTNFKIKKTDMRLHRLRETSAEGAQNVTVLQQQKKKKRVTRTENRESTPLSVAHWPALLKAYGRIRTRTICLRQIHVDLAALSDQRHILGVNQTLECVRHKTFINSILNQKVGAQEILRVLYHTRLLI